MNIFREIKAKSALAGALLRNVLVLPFRRSGAAGWVNRLAEEDLRPTAPKTWDRLELTSRCIACGLCDVTSVTGEPTSGLVMSGPRRPEDAPLVREQARSLAARADEIARICPAGVPAAEVAQLIEDNAAALSLTDSRRGEKSH